MKKYFSILVLAIITHSIFGQDTIYYDDNFNEIKSFKLASYYKVIKQKENRESVEKLYLKSGQIKSESSYKSNNKKKKFLNGKTLVWYESGELRFEFDYKEGKKNGLLLSYWKNGELKRKDIFKNGKFKKGECWDKNGNKIKYYNFIIPPKFPGGKKRLSIYISKTLKYPKRSFQYKIGGKVIINFSIEKDGSIANVKVTEGINLELNNEAIRVIKNMPRWSPGYQDGIPIRVKYRLPIRFIP